MEHEQKCRDILKDPKVLLPIGTMVFVKLNEKEKSDFGSSKFAPNYMGLWVIIERFSNDKTY